MSVTRDAMAAALEPFARPVLAREIAGSFTLTAVSWSDGSGTALLQASSHPEIELVEIEPKIDFVGRRALVAAIVRHPCRDVDETADGDAVPLTKQLVCGFARVPGRRIRIVRGEPQDLGALRTDAATTGTIEGR